MKKFVLFLFVLLLVFGCSSKKTPPEVKNSPSSLKKIEGPKSAQKNDSLYLINSAIDIVNAFAEGTYGMFASLNDIKDEMGDYTYSNGTWTWEVTYSTFTYKITCTEKSDGYEWKFYLNDVLYWHGYITKDGDHAWWKCYVNNSVGVSFEFEDNSNSGYIKFYNGDLNSNLFLWIEWTTTSEYCEVVFHAVGGALYEYQIREYSDHHGYAYIKENGATIFYVQWDSQGNIVK